MNDPRYDDLEKRVEKLEQERDGLLESHKEITKITKRPKFEAHEIKGIVGGIEVDLGDAREHFDTLERSQQELKEELHTISKIWLDSLQENVDDIKSEIHTALGTQNERFDQFDRRFDKVETTMATKDDITRLEGLIKQLLQQKPEGQP